MGSFFKPFYYLIYILIFLIIFISCFFTPSILGLENIGSYEININEKGFAWPAPGYTKINSYFGKRTSPTAGASSYHKGIDIAAPERK